MKYTYRIFYVLALLLLSCQSDDLIQDEINDQITDEIKISEYYEAELHQKAFSVNNGEEIKGTFDHYPIMDMGVKFPCQEYGRRRY